MTEKDPDLLSRVLPADKRYPNLPAQQAESRVHRVGNRAPEVVYVDITDKELISRIFVKRGNPDD